MKTILCLFSVLCLVAITVAQSPSPPVDRANSAPGKPTPDGKGAPPILGVPELFARADTLDGKRIRLTGFIGGTGGSGIFLAYSRDHLKIQSTSHERIGLWGKSLAELGGDVALGSLFGQYVYATGKLDVRHDDHSGALTTMSLHDVEISFLELEEQLQNVRDFHKAQK